MCIEGPKPLTPCTCSPGGGDGSARSSSPLDGLLWHGHSRSPWPSETLLVLRGPANDDAHEGASSKDGPRCRWPLRGTLVPLHRTRQASRGDSCRAAALDASGVIARRASGIPLERVRGEVHRDHVAFAAPGAPASHSLSLASRTVALDRGRLAPGLGLRDPPPDTLAGSPRLGVRDTYSTPSVCEP